VLPLPEGKMEGVWIDLWKKINCELNERKARQAEEGIM